MPVGWYVVQPPTDGSTAMTAKGPKAAMSGQQPEYGPMAAALKPYKMQMNGWIPTSGPVSAQIKKLVANFSKEYNTGTLESAVKKASFASIGQIPFLGNLAAVTPKVAMTAGGLQALFGQINAPMKKMGANISGVQSQQGVATGSIKKMGMSAIGGSSAAYGAMFSEIKKTSAQANGSTTVIELVATAHANAETVAMPSHQTGDIIVVFVSRVGSATPALQSGWTNIVNGSRAVGVGNWSARIAYKIAASSSETVGTWSTTEEILVAVFKNASSVGAAASQGITGSANKTVTYPGITLLGTNGKSRVIRMARGGGASATTTDLLTNLPGGYTLAAGDDSITLLLGDEIATSTSPIAQTQVTNDTNYWFAATIEIRGI